MTRRARRQPTPPQPPRDLAALAWMTGPTADRRAALLALLRVVQPEASRSHE